MPFNSNSYYANKYKRRAREYMDEARQWPPSWYGKDLHAWRSSRAELARLNWRMYLGRRRIQRMNNDHRSMTAADFLAKYELPQ